MNTPFLNEFADLVTEISLGGNSSPSEDSQQIGSSKAA